MHSELLGLHGVLVLWDVNYYHWIIFLFAFVAIMKLCTSQSSIWQVISNLQLLCLLRCIGPMQITIRLALQSHVCYSPLFCHCPKVTRLQVLCHSQYWKVNFAQCEGVSVDNIIKLFNKYTNWLVQAFFTLQTQVTSQNGMKYTYIGFVGPSNSFANQSHLQSDMFC